MNTLKMPEIYTYIYIKINVLVHGNIHTNTILYMLRQFFKNMKNFDIFVVCMLKSRTWLQL